MRALYITKPFDGIKFDMSSSQARQSHHAVYEVFPTGVNKAMDAQVAKAVGGSGLTYGGSNPCTLKNARDLGYPTGNRFWLQAGGFTGLPLALRTWFSNAEHCGPHCGALAVPPAWSGWAGRRAASRATSTSWRVAGCSPTTSCASSAGPSPTSCGEIYATLHVCVWNGVVQRDCARLLGTYVRVMSSYYESSDTG